MAKKVTVTTFQEMKETAEKITMLTAYDYTMAKIVDGSEVEAILVGDSLGMVMLGYPDTTGVTMEDMLHHTKAVSRGVTRAMVIADMPFLSYHLGIPQSVKNAGRLIQEGHAQAVKMEGGQEIIPDIRAIVRAGIPVMGHLGLTPQSIHTIGGYFIQGKSKEQAEKLIADALALVEAGVFGIVLECVPAELAAMITKKVTVPTIGIGAGAGCDGQVLVIHDLIGMLQGKVAKFVKQYGQIGHFMEEAISRYVQEVKNGVFPDAEHSYPIENAALNPANGEQK
ncbi:MAG TPA: 3-methyl-2-oxobutanoate hydroxymethyltransferase [Firmicutes bacterium]|jgi:3-methyl-2-oxobutanoate hydroxymethyltransferase|nr:3-methyl-2-oxobutanoate hydroxymethyltransferase [Bacillota bacterium]